MASFKDDVGISWRSTSVFTPETNNCLALPRKRSSKPVVRRLVPPVSTTIASVSTILLGVIRGIDSIYLKNPKHQTKTESTRMQIEILKQVRARRNLLRRSEPITMIYYVKRLIIIRENILAATILASPKMIGTEQIIDQSTTLK